VSDGEQFITTSEAAERVGVSPRRIRQFIIEGRLRARKRGRDHVIDVRDLASLVRRPTGRPAKRPLPRGGPGTGDGHCSKVSPS
jgi:excisionase family DNA binding protein